MVSKKKEIFFGKLFARGTYDQSIKAEKGNFVNEIRLAANKLRSL